MVTAYPEPKGVIENQEELHGVGWQGFPNTEK